MGVDDPEVDKQAISGDLMRMAAELERLRQENADLREAAALWIRLYENQLARANFAAELRRGKKQP
jgi:hypothetical protein